jgi:hypothetical protein
MPTWPAFFFLELFKPDAIWAPLGYDEALGCRRFLVNEWSNLQTSRLAELNNGRA